MEFATKSAVAFAQENAVRFVEELKELLRIPSISTDPERVGDVRRAAGFVADELRRIGMDNVRLIETTSAAHPDGHPLVYADYLRADAVGGRPAATSCPAHSGPVRRARHPSRRPRGSGGTRRC